MKWGGGDKKEKHNKLQGASNVPNNPPLPFALLSLAQPLVFPSLSAVPPLSLSAGSPAAASGGPHGEGTPGELTLALLLQAAGQTGLEIKSSWKLVFVFLPGNTLLTVIILNSYTV